MINWSWLTLLLCGGWCISLCNSVIPTFMLNLGHYGKEIEIWKLSHCAHKSRVSVGQVSTSGMGLTSDPYNLMDNSESLFGNPTNLNVVQTQPWPHLAIKLWN